MNPLPHLLRRSALLLGCCLPALAAGAAATPEPPEPTVITSESFEMRGADSDTVSVFDGRVVVTATGMRLTCDHLEVISVRIGDKEDTVGLQDRFKSLIATGNVKIVQGEREATCGRAEVLPRENRITLTENPVVTDRGNNSVMTGDSLEMLRNVREVRGRNVRIVGPTIRDLGFDAKQPPPAPAAPKKSAPQ